jgi:vitamin B12 transporter
MKRLFRATATVALICTPVEAQSQPQNRTSPALQEIVVTANRLGAPQRRDTLGTAVSVFERAQIDARQTRFALDILRETPGVAISRTGTIGGVTQVRLRGAESNHTLMLLDGADMSDPFQGEFDFSAQLANDVERIEVLRGEQSALYGSDAIGGVINIIPRRGAGPLALDASAEGGSFGTNFLSAAIGAGTQDFDWLASVGRYRTNGINVARFGGETDGARTVSAFLNAGWRPSEPWQLRAMLRFVDSFAETDPQDFAFPARATQGLVVDGDSESDAEQWYGAASVEHAAPDGAWTNKLSYAFADVHRDSFTNRALSFATEGRRDRLSFASAYAFDAGAAKNRVTAAFDWKRETYLNVPLATPGPQNRLRKSVNRGVVLAYDFTAHRLSFGVSYRADDNRRFRDAHTYRAQASYRLNEIGTRLRGSFGTGIKNPTNIELFGFNPTSFIGNPALKPERSRGWDVGIEQTFLDGDALFTVTYFNAELKDEIFSAFLPGFVSTPRNRTTESPRQGVELTFEARLAESLSLNAAFTRLDSEEAGLAEIRRPESTGSLGLTYRFFDDRASATVTVRHNGEQDDNEFVSATPQTRSTLAAYTLVNLSASVEVTDAVTVFGRIENLLDEDYEEVFSFRTQGRSAYAGTRVKF